MKVANKKIYKSGNAKLVQWWFYASNRLAVCLNS